ARLRVASLDHVLAVVVLLLRAAAEQVSRGVHFSWPHAQGAAGAARAAELHGQNRAPRARPTPGRGRGADHRLAAGSLRAAGSSGGKSGEKAPGNAKSVS